MPQTLTVAVCICDEVTFSDYIPPVEILSGLNIADHPMFAAEMPEVPYRVKIDYLAPSMKPVTGLLPILPTVNPTQTYDAAIKDNVQYDIIWVPAGPFPPERIPQAQLDFIKHQAPGAKYIMSVCGGSVPLAVAGLLDGKRATTNKKFFRAIESVTSKKITWVPKARWVIDGNIWTSSGVTAGTDMALAFLEHLAGPKIAREIRGQIEVVEREQEDDPFAAFHGLV